MGIWTLSDQSKLTYSLTSSRILEVPFTGLVMTDSSLDILYPLHHPSDKGKSYYFLWLDWLESNQLPIRYERTALTNELQSNLVWLVYDFLVFSFLDVIDYFILVSVVYDCWWHTIYKISILSADVAYDTDRRETLVCATSFHSYARAILFRFIGL